MKLGPFWVSAQSIEASFQTVFEKAIIQATKDGCLRPSIVSRSIDPLTRENVADNSGIGVLDIEIEYFRDSDNVEIFASFKGVWCGTC